MLRVLLFSLLVVAISACGDDAPEQPLPTSTPTPVDAPDALGPFDVGHASFTPVDASRDDRPLPVDIWYPVDAGDAEGSPPTVYPLQAGIGLDSEVAVDDAPVSARQGQTLLVFSHGYGGINTQSVALMEALASHGFIVVSPEHTGNAQGSLTDDNDAAAANRVPDVSFVIDTMLARSQDPEDEFYDRIDGDRVGVLGHSFGGSTAVGVVAGWAGAPPDPRVAAIVPLSGGIESSWDAEQLASITVPVMLVGGTEDTSVPISNNQVGFDQMTGAPNIYKVDVIGATHTHFANICSIGNMLIDDLGLGQDQWPDIGAEALLEPYAEACSPDAFPIEEAHRLQNLYIVSFFRRHLLDEQGYDQYLTTDYADGEPAINFFVR